MYIRVYELDSQEPIVNYRFESAGDLQIAENMMKLCHCRFDHSRMNYDISTDPKASVPIEDGKTNMYYVDWDDVVHNNALWGSDPSKTPYSKVSNGHYKERLAPPISEEEVKSDAGIAYYQVLANFQRQGMPCELLINAKTYRRIRGDGDMHFVTIGETGGFENYSDVAHNKPRHSLPLNPKPQVTLPKKSTHNQSPATDPKKSTPIQSSVSDVRIG